MIRVVRGLLAGVFAVCLVLFTVFHISQQRRIDKDPPNITCSEETLSVSVSDEESALLTGVTAYDEKDGDVSDSLVVVSKSRFSGDGTREVKLAAFDAAGNVATATRTVAYTDYTPPRFTLSGPLRFNASDYAVEVSDLISASDSLEGDISGLIKYSVGDSTFTYGEAGDVEIAFQVTTSAGSSAQVTLPAAVLTAEDYAKPYPELSTYLVYTTVGQQVDLSAYPIGACAGGNHYLFADYDEDESYVGVTEDYYSTDNVTYSGEVDYNTPGVYTVTYTLRARESVYDDSVEQGSVRLYVVVEE